MILRRPYAFFIKYFKIIHLVMALVMGFLLYRSNLILSFLTNYVNESPILTGSELTNSLFSFSMMVVPFIIVIASIIILSVMYIKKKPFVIYIFNIIFYIALIFVYSYASSTIGEMELKILDIRIVRILRDVVSIFFILQVLFSIVTVVRATGFDIKKFDFGQDLQELEVNEEDNEEFEIDVEFDPNKFQRKLNKNIRHFKYFYLENKFAMLVVIGIFVVTTSFIVYLNIFVLNKSYNQNDIFSASNLIMSVRKSYLLDSDKNGFKVSSKNSSLIALSINVKKIGKNDVKLNTMKFELEVGGRTFYPQAKYRDVITDLGKVYNNEAIKAEFDEYVFIYEVPNSYLGEKFVFSYVDSFKFTTGSLNPINTDVKLNVRDLRIIIKNETYKLMDNVSFKNSILNNIEFKVNSYDIKESFTHEYKKCIVSNECYDLVEYIVPNPLNSKEKVLLKISTVFNYSDTNKLSFLTDAYKLIEQFGEINYEIDGKEYKVSNLSLVKPTKQNENGLYYLEVDRNIEKAQKVKITFNVRDYKYVYNLK